MEIHGNPSSFLLRSSFFPTSPCGLLAFSSASARFPPPSPLLTLSHSPTSHLSSRCAAHAHWGRRCYCDLQRRCRVHGVAFASCHVMSRPALSCPLQSRCGVRVMLHVMSSRGASGRGVSWQVMSCHVMSSRLVSCRVVSSDAREESGSSASYERTAEIHAAHVHTAHTETTDTYATHPYTTHFYTIHSLTTHLMRSRSVVLHLRLPATYVFHLNFRCGVLRSYYLRWHFISLNSLGTNEARNASAEGTFFMSRADLVKHFSTFLYNRRTALRDTSDDALDEPLR